MGEATCCPNTEEAFGTSRAVLSDFHPFLARSLPPRLSFRPPWPLTRWLAWSYVRWVCAVAPSLRHAERGHPKTRKGLLLAMRFGTFVPPPTRPRQVNEIDPSKWCSCSCTIRTDAGSNNTTPTWMAKRIPLARANPQRSVALRRRPPERRGVAPPVAPARTSFLGRPRTISRINSGRKKEFDHQRDDPGKAAERGIPPVRRTQSEEKGRQPSPDKREATRRHATPYIREDQPIQWRTRRRRTLAGVDPDPGDPGRVAERAPGRCSLDEQNRWSDSRARDRSDPIRRPPGQRENLPGSMQAAPPRTPPGIDSPFGTVCRRPRMGNLRPAPEAVRRPFRCSDGGRGPCPPPPFLGIGGGGGGPDGTRTAVPRSNARRPGMETAGSSAGRRQGRVPYVTGTFSDPTGSMRGWVPFLSLCIAGSPGPHVPALATVCGITVPPAGRSGWSR